MARNKYPEQTKQKILDVSEQLFVEKGYDHTTIQDIIDQLGGLTKGVIYHHFKSKEEIFNTVLERNYNENVIEQLEKIEGANGFEKIKKINSLSLREIKHQKVAFSAQTLLTNPKIIGELYIEAFASVIPYVKELIEEGNADGSLEIEHPDEVAELFVLTTNLWLAPQLYDMTENELTRKIDFIKKMYEGVNFPIIDETFKKDLLAIHAAIKK